MNILGHCNRFFSLIAKRKFPDRQFFVPAVTSFQRIRAIIGKITWELPLISLDVVLCSDVMGTGLFILAPTLDPIFTPIIIPAVAILWFVAINKLLIISMIMTFRLSTCLIKNELRILTFSNAKKDQQVNVNTIEDTNATSNTNNISDMQKQNEKLEKMKKIEE